MKKRNCGSMLNLVGVVIFLGGFSQLNAQTWSTTGNAGTNGSTNFIGTTDAVDFKIRTNNTERIAVSSSGWVGFGTTTSVGSANFVISSSILGWGGMYSNGASSSTKAFYGYSIANNPVAWHYYDPSKNAWILSVGSGDRLTVTNTGNVGIGTTSPGYKLDVAGNGNFSGTVSAPTGSFTNGNFTNVNVGSFTMNSSGLNVSGNSVFTVTPEVVFNGPVTFTNTWFDAKEIWGSTNSSAPGVTGKAIANHPSLVSYGVYGDQNGSPFAYGVVCQGNGYYTGNWFQLSDQKFKTNVTGINSALNIVRQLQPKQYEYKRDEYKNMNFPEGQQYGFIAQDVEKVAPFLVKSTSQPVDMRKPDGEKVEFKMINYIGLIPVLTEAIKEQQAIIENQDSIIQQQNDRLTRLENKIDQLSPPGNESEKTSGIIQLNQLYPNQPNPFSQETVIKYNIGADASSASIVIRDMRGTIQKSIVLTQKGESSVTVQAQDMTTGLYTYELVVDGKIVDSKKMLVSK